MGRYFITLPVVITLSACGDDDGFPTAETFTPPKASNLSIEPETVVDSELSGFYLYSDNAKRPEGDSVIEWFINDEFITTSATFTPDKTVENDWIKFCITPVASYGNNNIGVKVCSTSYVIQPKVGSAPVASNVAIATPLQPGSATTASYSYSDADADLEGASLIQWRLNGVDSGNGLALTLPADSEGKSLEFCVTPIALTGEPKQGAQVCDTQTIIGSYIAPVASNLGITPQATPNTLLSGDYTYFDNASRPEGVSLYSWLIDGSQVSSNSTVTLGVDSEGKSLSFCVTPVASFGNNSIGSQVCTTPVVIQPKAGSAPVASNVAIATPLQPGSATTASYSYSDADADLEGASLIQWRLNGVDSGNGLALTLPADSEGKSLEFCVTPIALTGEPKQGAQVCDTQTIIGSYIAPVASNLGISPQATPNALLSGDYTYFDNASRPEGVSLYSWLIDGGQVSSNSTVTLGVDSEGKSLSFCVTPIASFGNNSIGSQVCTTPVIIQPKAGSAPVASNVAIATPLQPGSATTASYSYSDADADLEGASLTQWRLNGVDSGNGLAFTLPADSEGKSLEFCVTPIALTGEPKQGAQVCDTQTIIGSYIAPVATNLSYSPAAVVGSTLIASYDYSDSKNRPEGSSLLTWRIDGVDYASGDTFLIPVSEESNELSFCITPIASFGENDTGLEVCTPVETIAPKLGSAPVASNLVWDAFPKANTLLSVTYDFSDADGDLEGVSLFSWKIDNVEVSQSMNYTPPINSEGQSISFCVTPVAVSGSPKVGSETCITTTLAAIFLTGELKLYETLTLDVRGYSISSVSWKSTNPSRNAVRSTDENSYTIDRDEVDESAINLIGHDIEVCVTTVEEGEICLLASSFSETKVNGGLPIALDGSNNITQRAVAPVDYIELTIGGVTKRLHRPLTIHESIRLNASLPSAPLHDGARSENGSDVKFAQYTWPNANALCTARGMSLAVEGDTDTSDPFGLKQYFDDTKVKYPLLNSAPITMAYGWGTDGDYYWSSSDIGGGSHRDFYMVTGAPGTLADTIPEYAACIEIVP
ncbi:hypothetical protein [Shewanella subflava]|uniref:C-type lectin domain-containing protein n=1 Tax=Shewanella subflava TaxID=2986476 RepID=A0ABT3I7S4_9GAMM|nr:hypothetical protein [Shewanella subflava]MCW3172117.1 hypothetical protein [Shewanella subflava]